MSPSVRRDSSVVAAAWETDDAQQNSRSVSGDRSVLIRPSHDQDTTQQYDPFDEPKRVAQLPNDPFDETFEEPEVEDFPLPEPDLAEVEDAIKAERERRRQSDEQDTQQTDPFDQPDSQQDDEMPTFEERTIDDPKIDVEEFDLPTVPDDQDDLQLFDEEEQTRTPQELERGFREKLKEKQEQDLTAEESEEEQKRLAKELLKSAKNCQQELEKIETDRIDTIDLSIRVEGEAGEDYPFECQIGSTIDEPRQWPQITYTWKAAALCHKPLYFEQVHLERYGHSWGPYVQPIMSGVHFFGTLPVLPYKMGIRTPCECVYTLGYYRPGNCAPYLIDAIPFTWRAALFEAGVATAIPFIVP